MMRVKHDWLRSLRDNKKEKTYLWLVKSLVIVLFEKDSILPVIGILRKS